MTNSSIEKITINNSEAKSLDVNLQNIEQLKQIFPDIFSEGKIDFSALKAILGEAVDDSDERYNFTWNGKTKARQIAQTPSTGTLRPCKEESVNWDTTENLFIEGDNLEVLKLLQKSYHKKVKMIYIDPPYNTGNDFVYKDNFQNNIKNYLDITNQLDSSGNAKHTNTDTSGRYHSDWLNMIYPRIKLARNLLNDEGIIFISIDDKEQSNLRAICNEVFGEDNFIANFIWEKRTNRENRKVVSSRHDYVLCFAKNINATERALKQLPMNEKALSNYKNPDNDLRGEWKSDPATAQGGHGTKSQFYTLTAPNGKNHELESGRCWLYTKPVMEEAIKDGRIWFGREGNGVPRIKTYLHAKERGLTPETILFASEVGTNESAKNNLKKLFDGHAAFDTPKPVNLISTLMQMGLGDDDIILDFFAGSGTTAQSVYELNQVDNKTRKFILVQLPETTNAKSEASKLGYTTINQITKDRLKNVIKGITVTPGNKNDLGFKVLKLDETNIRPWDADFDNLEQILQLASESIKPDRSSEDVLYEIFLKYGYNLTTPVETEIVNGKQVFVVGAGALIVCLDDDITGEVVEGIAKLKTDLDPETTQVVFKDAGFADSNVKTNAIQILKQAGIEDVKSI
ncbi:MULTISPECIES: site-specific DNA-methyltransferase [unclassified Colwellia]|uniref:site-specific DNA-methyltransferase n=1 Tax=unclassified Colwellia TaxID=196834 RepID=UPI0015F5FCAA|nr:MULTISPECIES: site-specific DNA-methyltransferase [unclassified Colwellia]MBA6233966.1 site-specific DNA-methyltransferase [Colwellia sp. MB02u-7]MBA6236970.1 site-specific DNA-methyltransferase [Colwellia sp. MB02u-11]MBA6300640.1 site-specific DNA-methyltransferase [Colwellia sp. MB3u-22]MBA6310601.1 site-specific DNA-methyltransferase [Colwellia sp. MB3u-64]